MVPNQLGRIHKFIFENFVIFKKKKIEKGNGRTNSINGFDEIEPSRLIGCTYELIDSSCITDDDCITICNALGTSNTVTHTKS